MRYNLTLEELNSLLEYDEDDEKTLVFKWKSRTIKTKGGGFTLNSHYSGKRAGCLTQQGYTHLKLKDTIYKVHRLVYMLKEGIACTEDLPDAIDHINRDVTDNRKENLRDGSVNKKISINSRNRQNLGESKYIGVGVTDALRGKYSTTISINFNEIGLLYYKEEMECAETYKAACVYLRYEVDECYSEVRNIPLEGKALERVLRGLTLPKKEVKKSRFKGVTWNLQKQKFSARVNIYRGHKKVMKTVGYFLDDYEASVRRDLYIIENGFTNPLITIKEDDYVKYRKIYPLPKVKKVKVTCHKTGEVTIYGGVTPIADKLHLCKKTVTSVLNKKTTNNYKYDFEWVYVNKGE